MGDSVSIRPGETKQLDLSVSNFYVSTAEEIINVAFCTGEKIETELVPDMCSPLDIQIVENRPPLILGYLNKENPEYTELIKFELPEENVQSITLSIPESDIDTSYAITVLTDSSKIGSDGSIIDKKADKIVISENDKIVSNKKILIDGNFVITDSNGVISLKNLNNKNKVIIIDPGHGFIDSADGTSMRGAGYQGVYEVDIVLRIANYLKNELEAKGFSVFLTKSKNSENPTLAERAEFANHKNANFFISLHSDDFVPCPVSGGTHVLYYDISNSFFEDKDSNGKVDSLYVPRDNLNNVILNNYDLGTLMVNKLNKDLGMNKFYGAQSVRASDSGVLSRLDMPGVLIEIGFLCNDYDRKILLSKQQEIAQSIAQSTEEYYLGIS